MIDLADGVLLKVVAPSVSTVKVTAPPATWLTALRSDLAIGGGGAAALVHVQGSPSASWLFSHPFNRLPNVTVYDDLGNQVEADVMATTTMVNIVSAAPFSGTAVVN